MIVRGAHMGAANGVGKVQRQSPAGELDVVVRDRGNVAHLTYFTIYIVLTGYTVRRSVGPVKARGTHNWRSSVGQLLEAQDMEILLVVGAFVALAIAAQYFGWDSR